jgi:hypothetical protein
MAPAKTVINVSSITKGEIADLYFLSLGNVESRKNHILLSRPRAGPQTTPGQASPSVQDMEADFTCWYGGLQSIAEAVDPGVVLPPTKEMIGLITPQWERAKTQLAA